MKRDITLFLSDILDSIELIEKYACNFSKEDFMKNQEKIDSVVRRLEIIGEAVKNIDNSFRLKYPKIQWKKIAGLRDIITHSYFDIDFDITWDIIKRDIPDFKNEINKIFTDLTNSVKKDKNV